MDEQQRRFVARAIGRKRLFLWLSVVGVLAGVGLAGWAALAANDGAPGLRWVIVVLVLLNARQNLRQYRYASALEALVGGTR